MFGLGYLNSQPSSHGRHARLLYFIITFLGDVGLQ